MHNRSNRNQAHKNTNTRNYPGNPSVGKTNKEGILLASEEENNYNN
jgi:hypothetical protein